MMTAYTEHMSLVLCISMYEEPAASPTTPTFRTEKNVSGGVGRG